MTVRVFLAHAWVGDELTHDAADNFTATFSATEMSHSHTLRIVERLSVAFQQNGSFYSTILKLGRFVKDDILLHIK